jgi:hypothetical protein
MAEPDVRVLGTWLTRRMGLFQLIFWPLGLKRFANLCLLQNSWPIHPQVSGLTSTLLFPYHRGMPEPESEITPKVLLDHLQGMGQALGQQISVVRDELRAVEQRLGDRIRHLESRVARSETTLSQQIDGIDKRLDELEIVQLPRRVAALERRQ